MRRHELPGYTYKGIQTACFWNGRFRFGIYGETDNPAGRLDCAPDAVPVAAQGLQLRRWDGAAWRLLARTEKSAAVLEASGLAPYADSGIPGYNIGWIAVFAETSRGTVLSIL